MKRRTFSKTAVALPFAALTALEALRTNTATAAPAKVDDPNLSADALEILELDKQAELALPKMDVDFLGKLFSADMKFTHGDSWTNHNVVGNANTKEQWLTSIKNSNGQYIRKEANSQRIEMHGDIAVLAGRSSGRLKASAKQPEHDYEIWYVRIYAKREGRWQLVSHKTVRGPQDPTQG